MWYIIGWKRIIQILISECLALFNIFLGPRSGLRILLYHSVSPGVKDDKGGIFTVSSDLFRRHMETLVESKKLSLTDIINGKQTLGSQCLTIGVSFDDGYRDNLYAVAPIMEELNIPFTVFVVSDFVKKGGKDYLNRGELYELSKLPLVMIGSHGVTHIPLTRLSDDLLKEELESSKKYLEDITGKEINIISYPHGAVDLRVRNAVERAGYKIGVTSCFGINNRLKDPLLLNRTVILANDSERIFKQKLKGIWDWYKWVQKQAN